MTAILAQLRQKMDAGACCFDFVDQRLVQPGHARVLVAALQIPGIMSSVDATLYNHARCGPDPDTRYQIPDSYIPAASHR